MEDRSAIVSLIFSRLVYAVNYYNLASVFFLIAAGLGLNVSGLGLISSTFLLGIGFFQVPGGILAARIGPKKTSVLGMLISSFAALLSGFAANLNMLVMLRFLVGLGMALVFAPGVTLMARYFRKGSEGLSIGLYNSTYSFGGVLGLFGWVLIAQVAGWRFSIILGGGLGLLSTLFMVITIPPDSIQNEFRIRLSDLRRVIFDRWLMIVSIVLLGMSIGYQLLGNFVVLYVHDKLGYAGGIAGAIGSVVLLTNLASAPIAGHFFDRIRNVKRLLFISGTVISVGVALSSVDSVYAVIVASIMVGVGGGAGFTAGYASAREAARSTVEYQTLATGWVNSVSLLGGSWSPLIFSYLTVNYGYGVAWLVGSIYSFVLVLPILLAKRMK